MDFDAVFFITQCAFINLHAFRLVNDLADIRERRTMRRYGKVNNIILHIQTNDMSWSF